MREKKFRVWDKENKKMYFQLNESPCFGLFEGDRAVSIEDVFFYEKQRYETLQFTGLKDKNGKEIYEGDILIDHGDQGPVYIEYQKVQAAFVFVDKFDPSGTTIYTPTYIHYEAFEIVGNIYENPELLAGTARRVEESD